MANWLQNENEFYMSNKEAIIRICIFSPIIALVAVWGYNETKDLSFLAFFLIYLALLLISLVYLVKKELKNKETELKLCPYCGFKTRRVVKYCPKDQRRLVPFSTYPNMVYEPKYEKNPTKHTHITKPDSPSETYSNRGGRD